MKRNLPQIVLIEENQLKRLVRKIIMEQKHQSEMKRDANKEYRDMAGRIPMKEKYINLPVEDVFPATEFTEEEVEFVEHFLDKLGVNLESEVKIKYFVSPSQLIYLLTGMKREYDGFLSLDGKIDGNVKSNSPRETGYVIQSKPQKTPFV